MPLSPPQPAVPGGDYYLSFSFTTFETGALADPSSVVLELTYGTSVDLGAADVAGPFTYNGASSPAAGTIWRTGTGQYQFWWQVPAAGFPPGVYVANWTSVYGPNGDTFLAVENFPLTGGGPFSPVPSGDIGYWAGSLTYAPSWSPSPLSIAFGATDASGITWLWQSIEGWDSPPTAGTGVVQRSADHGGWPAPQYFGPRIITLTVMASAPTQALRDQARAQLQQVVPAGVTSDDMAVLQYGEPAPKLAYVRRNVTSQITENPVTLTDVIFQIPLVAPDPRKYATTPQTVSLVSAPAYSGPALTLPVTPPVTFQTLTNPAGSGIIAVNQGNFETRPVLTVTGPITSPAVVNGTTSQQITFTGLVLAAGDQLVLDTDNRQAALNGVNYPADVASAWWVLEPGTSQVYLAGRLSTGANLTMTYASAWI